MRIVHITAARSPPVTSGSFRRLILSDNAPAMGLPTAHATSITEVTNAARLVE